jgi:hypothetical protein
MVSSTTERRQHPRQQVQQQPQQSEVFPPRGKNREENKRHDSPRLLWQALIETQARKQSGKL